MVCWVSQIMPNASQSTSTSIVTIILWRHQELPSMAGWKCSEKRTYTQIYISKGVIHLHMVHGQHWSINITNLAPSLERTCVLSTTYHVRAKNVLTGLKSLGFLAFLQSMNLVIHVWLFAIMPLFLVSKMIGCWWSSKTINKRNRGNFTMQEDLDEVK